jgi:hypothetical protein
MKLTADTTNISTTKALSPEHIQRMLSLAEEHPNAKIAVTEDKSSGAILGISIAPRRGTPTSMGVQSTLNNKLVGWSLHQGVPSWSRDGKDSMNAPYRSRWSSIEEMRTWV